MQSNLVPGLAAIALGFGIIGVAAAPMDSTLNAGAIQANSTFGSLQPPAGAGLNQKGLAAIKPAAAQPSVSALTSNNVPSTIAKTDTDNMLRHPDSAENRLTSNLQSGSDKALTNDMLRPPPK
jgi:hypothetical protein